MKTSTHNKKPKFSLSDFDPSFLTLVKKTDQKTLALWAVECAERVLPYFERERPNDDRPRKAIETLRSWIKTGDFKMSVIRGASLASHAAAREVGEDNAARSAARAAGQAVATAHVPIHALAGAQYALQAIHRAANPAVAAIAVAKERDWQHRRLLRFKEKKALKPTTSASAR